MKKFIKAGLIVYLLLSVNYLTKGQMPYTRESWQYIATKMPDEWYGYEESKAIAENVLLYQRDLGG
ncbi:MAG: hypothetical protein NTW82_09750 [Bacteroidia bacterium]|nr:hypothetical protein [Bacteroidia bacterium]